VKIVGFILLAILALAVSVRGTDERAPLATPSASATPTGKSASMEIKVPQAILEPILADAAARAKVGRDKLVIVRAEAVVWNDGSLGCPEPGMEYAQALVNGYWVVINAAGQTYDFRVGPGGSFRLCPAGRGRPPSRSDDAT
jgi:hypothetical protein